MHVYICIIMTSQSSISTTVTKNVIHICILFIYLCKLNNFQYYFIQVNNNGIISFMNVFSEHDPRLFPLQSFNIPVISPFWADADTSQDGSGAVFYRETTDFDLLQRVSTEIQFGLSMSFTPTHLLIATWDAIGYYNMNTDRVNKCVRGAILF